MYSELCFSDATRKSRRWINNLNQSHFGRINVVLDCFDQKNSQDQIFVSDFVVFG